MPIRDLVLTAFLLGSLPFCFVRPWVGVLVWSWVGFMNPHRLSWGFARDIGFAQLVAIPTLAGLLFTRRRGIPLVRESVLLAALWALFAATTVFALFPALAWPDLKQVSKILLMVFVTVMLFQDRERLRYLLLISALSIGYFGLKGGIWGLATGGNSGHVLGPEGSFIGDNNGVALGLNMTLPLLFYLAREESRRWLRLLLRACFVFGIVAVLLTFSRSGAMGLAVTLVALMFNTKRKWLAIATIAAGILTLVAFLPERWFERIGTIGHYEVDGSAMARFNAWTVAWRLANDMPFLGGGFRAFQPAVWRHYLPDYPQWHNAHSIYFHILGEHGFTGLVLYAGLLVSMLWSLTSVARQARALPGARWLVDYALMTRTSLLAFMVTGAFQNLTYFDLFFLLVGITIILKQLLADTTREARAAPPVATTVPVPPLRMHRARAGRPAALGARP